MTETMIPAMLEEAVREVELSGNSSAVIDAGRKWSGKLAAAGAEGEIDKLSDAMTKRLKQIGELTNDDSRLPKIERGHVLVPTPRLGDRILWLENNDPRKAFPADVCQVEGPGRVAVKIHRLAEMTGPGAMKGVRHCTDPVHARPNAPASMSTGSWMFLENTKPGQWIYGPARAEIAKREASKRRAEQDRLDLEARVAEQDRASRERVDNLETADTVS